MKEAKTEIAGIVKALAGVVGIRDFFVFGGLGLMGYGLHIYEPWVAYTVCGACLAVFGVFGGGRS